MFGPNTIGSSLYELSYSHRDKKFKSVFAELTQQFKQKFELQDYDFLFIAGSGTIGIEATIASYNGSVDIVGSAGKFKDRWKQLSNKYATPKSSNSIEMFCQLETSCSEFFDRQGCIVDAVSSFPYLSIPENTPIFITCSNKQLGAFPGISIVGVHKDFWSSIKDDDSFSYLNLKLHKKYSEDNQTLTTAPTPLFEHLLEKVKNINVQGLRQKIDIVSDMLVGAVGEDNIIGEHRCPVITFKKTSISDTIAKKYELYGINNAATDCYQVFTYSHPIDDYTKFALELIHEGN